jgi:hypothetical protein
MHSIKKNQKNRIKGIRVVLINKCHQPVILDMDTVIIMTGLIIRLPQINGCYSTTKEFGLS